MNISKELLSEVLGVKVVNYEIVENTIVINPFGDRHSSRNNCGCELSINIYELSHKNLKEWAYSKGYIIESTIRGAVVFVENSERVLYFIYKELYIPEEKAIALCCEWILQKENK